MWAERRRVPRTDLKSKEPAKVIEERCAVRQRENREEPDFVEGWRRKHFENDNGQLCQIMLLTPFKYGKVRELVIR